MRPFATHRFWAALPVLALLLVIGAGAANAQVSPLWDHYRVYVVDQLLPGPPVGLTDQFGSWQYSHSELTAVANPDEKTHGPNVFPINDPRLHHTWWYLGPEPYFRPGVVVTNQFGPQRIDVIDGPRYLVNPALKNAPAGEQIPIANHYKCYWCQGDPVNITVGLRDQFYPRDVVVAEPRYLCNPAAKTAPDGREYPILEPDQHYVCYWIGLGPGTFTALVTDQFVRDHQVLMYSDQLLCVPSEKHDATPSTPSTWGRLKTLYR